MKWLKRNRLEELPEHLNLIQNRQLQILDMLAKMGAQQGVKFKREKNPRRQEAGRRAWATKLAKAQQVERANGFLGLVDGPKES